jgi:hypothetical protein
MMYEEPEVKSASDLITKGLSDKIFMVLFNTFQ